MNRLTQLLTALLLAPLAALHAAELRVVNGDFSDLTGLTTGDAHGWHSSVPAGWESSSKDTKYSVNSRTGLTPPVCNLSQLDYLDQKVGTLTQAADVVLKFDVSEEWQTESGLGAAILNGSRATLVKSSFHAGRGQTLVATNVSAGTTIYLRFWALWKTTPGLDNVSVAVHPPGSQAESGQPPASAGQIRGVLGDLDAAFRNPPNAYRVIQYSRHDGAVLPIARMREYGIGGVMLFLSRHNYLRNEEAWANMKTNSRLAKEAGMQVWVADDNGFPSGQAGGLVVAANPAFELRCLLSSMQRGQGTAKARMALPSKAESFVAAMIYPEKDGQPVYPAATAVKLSGDHLETTGLDGPWVLQAFALKINNDPGSPGMHTKDAFGNTGHYPNLLDSAAMEKFVDLTHAEYARRLGSLKGQIDLFYCNEPHLGTTWHAAGQRPSGEVFVPWVADMPQRFRKDHGYDLVPFLPALFGETSDEAKLVRRHFFQTVGKIFSQNYPERIARWAEANGVRSGGHLLLEERMDSHVIGYGNFFQAMKEQHIPGCDVPMPDPGDDGDFWFPKLISSAAQLRGRETVSALFDPIIYRRMAALQPKPESMMRTINMAFLTGMNQICSYVAWDHYPPEVYRRFNENVGRLAVMLRGARNVSTIAIYYPIETFQSRFRPSPKVWTDAERDNPESFQASKTQEQVIRSLYRHGCDFSWLDGDTVLGAEIHAGRLVIGAHEYTSLIMPRVELLPLPVVQKLQQFEKAGGKVLWVDSLPCLGDKPQEHAAVRAAVAASRSIPAGEVAKGLGSAFPGNFRLRMEGGGEGLFFARYLRNGHRVNYLVNNSDKPIAPKLSLAGQEAGKVWLYSPADGGITTREVPGQLTMHPCTSVFVVE